MGGLKKHMGIPTWARGGMVILAAAVALLLIRAGGVVGSGASSQGAYRPGPRFVELMDVDTYNTAVINGGTSLEDTVSSMPVAAEAAPAQPPGAINRLRVYGRSDEDAVFPYSSDNYWGPFGLTNAEAPSKDFVQFNPAIMLEGDDNSLGKFGEYFQNAIKAEGDASEKVHLRMWYVPEYPEPRGLTYPEVEDLVINEDGDIVLEYTYMLLEPDTLDPKTGPPGSTRMVFPMAGVSGQPGLDGMDVNGDGEPEALSIDEIVGVVEGTLGAHEVVTYTEGLTDNLKTTRGIVEVSAKEVLAPIRVSEGGQVQFLDYMVRLEGVSLLGLWADVSVWYIGNESPLLLGSVSLELGEAALAGRFWGPSVEAFADGAAAEAEAERAMVDEGLPARPFWVTLDSIVDIGGETYVRLTPHRLLMTGETFFVDRVEYDVAGILVEDADLRDGEIAPEIEYISIRNPLPKWDEGEDPWVVIPGLTVWKRRIPANESLWMLPPFNYEHDMVDDVNIPEDLNDFGPDCRPIDNIDTSAITDTYDLIEERVVEDVGALDGDLFIGWSGEDKEERFDTNLLEQVFWQWLAGAEWVQVWYWINVETMPWDYTEFILPELPDRPTEEGYTTGDYMLVSSFLTEDSTTTEHGAGAVRLKFAYDAEDGTGIYVNEATSRRGSFRGRVKLESCDYQSLTLTVKIVEGDSVIMTEAVSTDPSGYFSLELDPGTYNVWVKEQRALARRIDDVVITAGAISEHDFGELLVGDVDDNLVDIGDFGVWKSTFCNVIDLRADFDCSGNVDIDDFAWVKRNFLKQGDDPLAGSPSMPYDWETSSPIRATQAGTVTVYLDPAASSATAGETFTVAVKIAAGVQEVDSAQAFVDFDPTYLDVIDVTGGGVLDEVHNEFDSVPGEIGYAGVDLVGTVSGTFTLATVTFQARVAVPETALIFSVAPPRETKAKLGITTLPLETQSAAVEIRGVVVSIEPPSETVHVGETFTLAVKIEAGMQQVDGAQAYVDFAPEHLAVTGISGGGVLPDELYSSYTNTLGQVDYAAGYIGGTVSGTFNLATFTFKALTETTGAPTLLSFHMAPPRETLVILAESTLTSTLSGGQVVIGRPYYVYLPLVLRSYTPLQADFTASPVQGRVPLTVTFTNTSLGFYTDSLWDFGDGITSTHTNPTHTYTLTGTYSVTLTVVDASDTLPPPLDSSTLVRLNYITVSEEGPPAAPSDLEATVLSWHEIRLDWRDNSSDETGFSITDGVAWADVVSNTTAYTFTGLSPGSYHCYVVRAFNEFGDSGWNDDDGNGEPDWACTTTFTRTSVIVNGGFEEDEGWTILNTAYPAAYTVAITHTGARALRTGIVDPGDNVASYSSAQQTVTIPSDVVSATLGFWLYTLSGELTPGREVQAAPRGSIFEAALQPVDWQYVLVLDEQNQVLGSELVWGLMNDQEWVYYEFDLAKPVYLGRTVRLRFGASNDGLDGITAMYVDDVSLEFSYASATSGVDHLPRQR
jgi:PKD repeat protein